LHFPPDQCNPQFEAKEMNQALLLHLPFSNQYKMKDPSDLFTNNDGEAQLEKEG